MEDEKKIPEPSTTATAMAETTTISISTAPKDTAGEVNPATQRDPALTGLWGNGLHHGWEPTSVAMAKCDMCSRAGRGVIYKCTQCKLSTCRECCEAGCLDRDSRHDLDPSSVSWEPIPRTRPARASRGIRSRQHSQRNTRSRAMRASISEHLDLGWSRTRSQGRLAMDGHQMQQGVGHRTSSSQGTSAMGGHYERSNIPSREACRVESTMHRHAVEPQADFVPPRQLARYRTPTPYPPQLLHGDEAPSQRLHHPSSAIPKSPPPGQCLYSQSPSFSSHMRGGYHATRTLLASQVDRPRNLQAHITSVASPYGEHRQARKPHSPESGPHASTEELREPLGQEGGPEYHTSATRNAHHPGLRRLDGGDIRPEGCVQLPPIHTWLRDPTATRRPAPAWPTEQPEESRRPHDAHPERHNVSPPPYIHLNPDPDDKETAAPDVAALAELLAASVMDLRDEYPGAPVDLCLRHEVVSHWARHVPPRGSEAIDHTLRNFIGATCSAADRLGLDPVRNGAREWLMDMGMRVEWGEYGHS